MRARTFGLVLVVMVCFAFNSLATRYLVSRGLLDAASVTAARFVSGALMLAILLAAQRRATAAIPQRRDLALIGLLGGYALAIAYGYRSITAAAGTFVFYALVIATMTLGGPRPTSRAIGGALLALVGVGLLALGRVAGTTLLGVALLAATGATWGAYSLMLRKRGDPIATNGSAFLGLALLTPVLLAVDRSAIVLTWQGLAIGAFMGAITTALAYALWARVLPELAPVEAGTMQLLVPVLTAAGGVLALGEPFGWRLAAAGVLVLSGMAIATVRGQGPEART